MNIIFRTQGVSLLSIITLIALAYFVSILVAMHKLRSDLKPLSQYISEYALGNYGKLAKSGFVIYGIAILGVYLNLTISLSSGFKSNLGLMFIATWGISNIITGFFDVDPIDEPLSSRGIVHLTATIIGVVSSVIGLILLSFSFAIKGVIPLIAFVTILTAIVASALVVVLLIGFICGFALKYCCNLPWILLLLHSYTGLLERLLVGISVVWLAMVAYWI